MNIRYNQEKRIFKLDTQNSSYLIGIVDKEGFPGHIYYGRKLYDWEDGLLEPTYLMRNNEPPFVPSVNGRERSAFLDTFPMEYPGNNVGDYRESAIEILDENGHAAVQPLYKGHRIYAGKPKLPGLPATFGEETACMTLELITWDCLLGLEMILYYSVFTDSDALARSVVIRNQSEKNIALTKVMSMSIDMDQEDYQMMSLHGSWARERQIEYRPIGYGKQSISSVRGESSHQEHPFLALISENASQESGEIYGFHFVYSGNFLAQIEKNQFDSLRVSMGIHPKNFCFQLKPGECFTAPEVIMVYSALGIGHMTRTYHNLYRNHLIRSTYKDKKRPVLINNWEATYFDFNTEKLLIIAQEAKKAGIEMLVMDDGWFGNRNDDSSSLGDWEVNETKIVGGLKHLVEEVNKIGLKFGIWFEPEMISPDSNLYRKHPDWAIAIPGREGCRSRNQYVLDLTRTEVMDYAYNCIAKILHSANIEYIKWDMNRQLTDIGSTFLHRENQGELMHRYVLAVYEMQERLVREFPNILLENCSGGGARFDPGMLYYSPQIWCSDDTDAIERLSIQEGTQLLYPLSCIGAHVSDCPNHTVGRVTPFETRGHVALAGTFGYELDITKISEKERAMIPGQIRMYHRFHDLIRTGNYYRIASYRENHSYDAYAVVAQDQSEALVTYVQVLSQANVHSRMLKIPGLAEEKRYCLEGEDGLYRGDILKYAGIPVGNIHGDFCSKLFHFILYTGI